VIVATLKVTAHGSFGTSAQTVVIDARQFVQGAAR
jgi:hypothetical protein